MEQCKFQQAIPIGYVMRYVHHQKTALEIQRAVFSFLYAR